MTIHIDISGSHALDDMTELIETYQSLERIGDGVGTTEDMSAVLGILNLLSREISKHLPSPLISG